MDLPSELCSNHGIFVTFPPALHEVPFLKWPPCNDAINDQLDKYFLLGINITDTGHNLAYPLSRPAYQKGAKIGRHRHMLKEWEAG